MRRSLLAFGVAGIVFALAGTGTSATAKDRFQLKGEVYPNSLFKIEMKNAAGRPLKTVKRGTYRIKIEDRASIHNFRLKGPGVNKSTSVSGVVRATWTVSLKKGTYRISSAGTPRLQRTLRVT